MSMEMDTCRKSGIEEISNYAVRLQDKGDKEARENIDKLMIFYVSLGCKFATNEKVISKAKYCVTCYGRQCIRVVIEKDEFHITKDEFWEKTLKFSGQPKTSQPSPMEFKECFERVLKKGYKKFK